MLSAAPGFFVDHEDGEGLGNDVYLRGFDLDNGSGIEMKVGGVPINIPLHIHGQGYADVNFIIPEVVQSVRVLEGSYDPRQGDSAIVGSAYFDLGRARARLPGQGDATARSARRGSSASSRPRRRATRRSPRSRSARRRLRRRTARRSRPRSTRSTASTSAARSPARPGDRLRRARGAARRGAPGRRQRGPHRLLRRLPELQRVFPSGCSAASCSQPAQGVRDRAHHRRRRARSHVPAAARTSRSRRGSCGPTSAPARTTRAISTARTSSPSSRAWAISGSSPTWRSPAGVTARFRARPAAPRGLLEIVVEPGVSLRGGHTDQTKSLLNPADLDPWDYRQRLRTRHRRRRRIRRPRRAAVEAAPHLGRGARRLPRRVGARTTWPASCRRSRPARCPARSPTSPASRPGRA